MCRERECGVSEGGEEREGVGERGVMPGTTFMAPSTSKYSTVL